MRHEGQIYRTYDGWIMQGRAVRQGEKALYYAVNEDELRSRALFDIEQTDELTIIDDDPSWQRIVPAQNRPASGYQKKPTKQHRIKVDGDANHASVWCGSNKIASETLRKGGYRYDQRARRWIKVNKSAEEVASALAGMGFSVDHEYSMLTI